MTTLETEDHDSLIPFLKWAGGKRWLTSNHLDLFPTTYERYIEPFLGSAAVFFALEPERGILSDRNADLIETYRAIRDDWKSVEDALKKHQANHRVDYYYDERERRRQKPHTRAAHFIYMNRTCWNGLYRVNLQGKFNVPIGTKTAVCLDTDDFEKTSKALRKMHLMCADFQQAISQAREGDFIFVDPPYTVKHNMNGFVKYNEQIFSWNDQVRLRDALLRAWDKGALISITNADHDSIRDLYRDFQFHRPLSRASVLAGKSSARSDTTELLIRNWG
ncbi:MAG: DNA methyltransferase [Alphaproteobacteria bacterium HGW-Alphaproteobacteria-3]|nr:MAG: DNA methyltransferase [Alphaproteobacteria bacterium HGW-Alphaproteobacteria-3]